MQFTSTPNESQMGMLDGHVPYRSTRPFSSLSKVSSQDVLRTSTLPERTGPATAPGGRETRDSVVYDGFRFRTSGATPDRDAPRPKTISLELDTQTTPLSSLVTSRGRSRSLNRSSLESKSGTPNMDAIVSKLQEHVKNSFAEFKQRFTSNDPDLKGVVSKEGLQRTLSTSLSMPLSASAVNKLLDRIGLSSHRTSVSFNEFVAHLCKFGSLGSVNEYPEVVLGGLSTRRKTEGMLKWLKERTLTARDERKQDTADILKIVEETPRERAKTPAKEEFSIEKLSLPSILEGPSVAAKTAAALSSGDPEVIKSVSRPGRQAKEESLLPAVSSPSSAHLEAIPSTAGDVEVEFFDEWLHARLHSGYLRIREAFAARDPDSTGLVFPDDFLNVLRGFGIILTKVQLPVFMKRAFIEFRNNQIPYRELLNRFIHNDENLFASQYPVPVRSKNDETETFDIVMLKTAESKMGELFLKGYMDFMRACWDRDPSQTGLLPQKDFELIVQTRLGLKISPEKIKAIYANLPLNSAGLFKYRDYFKQLETGFEHSLAGTMESGNERRASNLNSTRSHSRTGTAASSASTASLHEPRPLAEVISHVGYLVNAKFEELENRFKMMPEYNSQRLTLESLYQLLKRLNPVPEITRSEVRALWTSRHFYQDVGGESVKYAEFLRSFTNRKSCAFPNAKTHPPRKGDADYMLRSRNLNADTDLIREELRTKMEVLIDEARRAFEEQDRNRTGLVTPEVFIKIVKQLEADMNRYELERLAEKFVLQLPNKSKMVCYSEFLRPFELRRSVAIDVSSQQDKMRTVLKHGGRIGHMLEAEAIDSARSEIVPLGVQVQDAGRSLESIQETPREGKDWSEDNSKSETKQEDQSKATKEGISKRDPAKNETFKEKKDSKLNTHRKSMGDGINSRHMATLLPMDLLKNVPHKPLFNIVQKHRIELSQWREIYKACARLDSTGSGFVPLTDFRGLLEKTLGIRLSEEEWFDLLTDLDSPANVQLALESIPADISMARGSVMSDLVPGMTATMGGSIEGGLGRIAYGRFCTLVSRYLHQVLGGARNRVLERERTLMLEKYEQMQLERRAALLEKYRKMKTEVQRPPCFD